jgi:hypothetical protein
MVMMPAISMAKELNGANTRLKRLRRAAGVVGIMVSFGWCERVVSLAFHKGRGAWLLLDLKAIVQEIKLCMLKHSQILRNY